MPVEEHFGPLEKGSSYELIPAVNAVVHLAAVSQEQPTKQHYEVIYGTSVLARWMVEKLVPSSIFFIRIRVRT